MSDAPTVLGGDVTGVAADQATHLAPADDTTRLAGAGAASGGSGARPAPRSGGAEAPRLVHSSGWLGTSGSIDHGRFPPGQLFDDRYRVVGLLGRGGMGEVYRADDLRLGQPVALKFLPEALGRDPVRLAQFHNEVRTARQVSHANVCRVYDIGEVNGDLFLTMEYVDGEDLSSLLRRIGRLPEDKAVEIARQICAGLAAAHERGVLHRDLKPANIMVDGAGKVRIMDFSLAAVGPVTDIRAGTPAYMAPEQLQGREVTARSDIFALGLVLYELFTGKRVFDVKTIAELVSRHEAADITAPTTIVRGLDPSIESAILRCLNPDPAKRPGTALVVSSALPGGDPLAAALAAGETPSPELVAAAGGEAATLSGAVGAVLVVTIAALLAVLAVLTDRTTVLPFVPLDKSRPVLADRAGEMVRQFGYTQTFTDSASGFDYDNNFLAWLAQRETASLQRKTIPVGQPAAIRFWYRASTALMVPYSQVSDVDLTDPPLTSRGMVRVDLDTRGRLLMFDAVPVAKMPVLAASVDWDRVFAAAGLDRSKFTEVPTRVLARGVGDERRAWEGVWPDASGDKIRIDAVGSEGRPTIFAILNEWEVGDFTPGGTPNPIMRAVGVLIVAALPAGAAILARRNLRLGRGDRRGAFRTWAVAFTCVMLGWLIAPGHVNGLEEVDRLFAMAGLQLFWTGLLYMAYLALEPYVRRTWPSVLVTWSRAVSGKLRDPFVGRDILIGLIAGILIALIPMLFVLVPGAFGLPLPKLALTNLSPIFGGRYVLARLIAEPGGALQNGFIVMLILCVIRQGLKGAFGRVRGAIGRYVSSDLAMGMVSVVVFVLVIKRSSIDPAYPTLDLAFSALLIIALLVTAFRFGLFALCCAFFVVNIAGDSNITLLSKPYAGPAWAVAGVLFAMAILGFWLARAGEPLFGRSEA
jgi:predicted Ser/Thr protein kinase